MLPLPRVLNVIEARWRYGADAETTEKIDAALAWPKTEAELRAEWGMTAEAQAGQAAMIGMVAGR